MDNEAGKFSRDHEIALNRCGVFKINTCRKYCMRCVRYYKSCNVIHDKCPNETRLILDG